MSIIQTITPCEDFRTWGGGYTIYDQASNLVINQFESTEEYATVYSNKVLGLMDDLIYHIENNGPENPDLSYDMVDDPGIDVNVFAPPPAPNVSTVVIPDKPLMRGEILPIVMGNPLKPVDDTISDPAPPFVYEESPYLSQLLIDLKARIIDIVNNGGQGLPDATFESILDIALSADELEFEKNYTDAESYYSAKNHFAPPGALVSRLNMIIRERYRNQQRIVGDLTNKQAELAYNQEQFIQDLAIKLEALEADDRNKVADRAYQLAKDIVTFHYTAVEQSIKLYQSKLDAYKTEWSAEEVRVNAITSGNRSLTDTLTAELKSWEVGITVELAVIEQIVKVYIAETTGYESLIKAETMKAEVMIDEYKAKIQESGQKASITVEEARLALQNATAVYNLSADSMKHLGTLSSQITSSALSAFNTSASLSAGVTYGNSWQKSQSKSCSNTGSERISVSENYNYSV